MKIFHNTYGWINNEVPEVGERYEVAHGGKLVGGTLIGYGSHTANYLLHTEKPDDVTLTIKGDKESNVMHLGETLNFTATFSDSTINASVPVSIVNREGVHVINAFVVIKDGVGTGTFSPDVAVDYYVTEEAINFHSSALGVKLVLTEPFYIRVVKA